MAGRAGRVRAEPDADADGLAADAEALGAVALGGNAGDEGEAAFRGSLGVSAEGPITRPKNIQAAAPRASVSTPIPIIVVVAFRGAARDRRAALSTGTSVDRTSVDADGPRAASMGSVRGQRTWWVWGIGGS